MSSNAEHKDLILQQENVLSAEHSDYDSEAEVESPQEERNIVLPDTEAYDLSTGVQPNIKEISSVCRVTRGDSFPGEDEENEESEEQQRLEQEEENEESEEQQRLEQEEENEEEKQQRSEQEEQRRMEQDVIEKRQQVVEKMQQEEEKEKERRRLKQEEKERNLPVVERSTDYWKNLYDWHHNRNLKQDITSVLNYDINFYTKLLRVNAQSSKATLLIRLEDVTTEHWVVYYVPQSNLICVIPHSQANVILQDWCEFDLLPKTLPIGVDMPTVATFDQLLALMVRFNPFWLLEKASFTLTNTSFGHRYVNDWYSYKANIVEIKQIRDNLTKLLSNLS